MKSLIAIAAVCLSLSAGMVVAEETATPARGKPDPQQRQQRMEQMKARWQQADANQDGRLSRDEAEQGMPRLAQHFDKLDADGDGQLTGDELRAAHQARSSDRQQNGRPARPQN